MAHHRTIDLLFSLVILIGLVNPSHAWNHFGSGTVGFVSTDNLTDEIVPENRLTDWGQELGLAFGSWRTCGRADTLTVAADLKTTRFKQYDFYSHDDYGLRLNWRHKLGMGPMAPWWRLGAGTTVLDFQQSLRDRRSDEYVVEWGKRLHRRFGLIVKAAHDRDHGKNSPVFDGRGNSARVQGRYDLAERASVQVGYQYRKGTVVTQNDQGMLGEQPQAIVPDSYYGGGTYTYTYDPNTGQYIPSYVPTQKVVTRLDDARTDLFFASLSRAVSRSASVNLQLEWKDTSWGPHKYATDTVRFAYLLEF